MVRWAKKTSSGRKRKKVCLIYCPDSLLLDYILFPPYALSVYRGQIEDAGFDVDVVDLSHVVLRNERARQIHSTLCRNNVLNNICPPDGVHNYSALIADSAVTQLISAFVDEVKIYKADFYCISIMHAPAMYGMALISAIKRNIGGVVIAGGRAISFCRDLMDSFFYLCPELDYLLSMPRNDSLLNLLRLLSESGNIPSPSVPGLAYIRSGRVEYCDPDQDNLIKQPLWCNDKPSFSTDNLSRYAYGLAEMKKLLRNSPIRWRNFPECTKNIRAVADQFYSGCVNRCIFCQRSVEPKTDRIAPQKMARRLIEIYDEHGCEYFFLLNSSINPTYAYAEAFCDELIRHRRPIFFSDSADFRKIDARLLDKLHRAGCLLLWWGSEIISDRMLKYVNKKLTVSEIKRGIRLSHEAGIFNCLNFIVGMPYEQPVDIDITEIFIRENQHYIDGIALNAFQLAGLLKKYPLKYGIRTFISKGQVVYDEICGLKWSLRQKLTQQSLLRLRNIMNREINEFSDMSMNIFYMHAAMGNYKARIKEAIRKFLPGDANKVPY